MNPGILAAIPLLLGALTFAEPAAASCGAEGERACTVAERIPSCDVNLTEAQGRCVRPACGREGQRGCALTERITMDVMLKVPLPQVCDANLVHDVFANVCRRPDCGREGQQACTVLQRIPSCDLDLLEADNGRCIRLQCGGVNQPFCDPRVVGYRRPASNFSIGMCDANLVANQQTQTCTRPGDGVSPPGAAAAAAQPAPPAGAPSAPPAVHGGVPVAGAPPPPPPQVQGGMPVTSGGPPPPPPARSGTPPAPPPAVAWGGSSTPPGALPPPPPVVSAPQVPPPPPPQATAPQVPRPPQQTTSTVAPGVDAGYEAGYRAGYAAGFAAASGGGVGVQQEQPAQPVAINGVTMSAPPTVRVGGWVSVEWTGPMNNQDYIVVARPGTPPGLANVISYRNAYSGSPSSVGPVRGQPGVYEIWYLDDRRKVVLNKLTIEVTP